MTPDTWIEHRRSRDSERLGWMIPEGDGFVVVDLLGRRRSEPVDWLEAEELLESIGIGYLADPYELDLRDQQLPEHPSRIGLFPVRDGWARVRITEVSDTAITVKWDDGGDINAPQRFHRLPFPMPASLRPLN
ncbi:MAG: hypothetical protein ACTJHU_00110 [Mycetocola sp.]